MPSDAPQQFVETTVANWLQSCVRKGKIARNTYAVGLVVLNALRSKCPVSADEMFTDGHELKGARSALKRVLKKYDIDVKYLKEATSRQAGPDGERLLQLLELGEPLAGLDPNARDAELMRGVEVLLEGIRGWFARKHLKIKCPRTKSPSAWIAAIIAAARGRSGGIVEQHLVGAKLAERFPGELIANHPGHAGDVQTSRNGDFQLGTTVYHVTAAPTEAVIARCGDNVEHGLHPYLLVPSDSVQAAKQLAKNAGLADDITITSIEDFVALNVIELAEGEQRKFIEVLSKIVDTYNDRLEEVETDRSLRIEVD